MKCAPAEDTGGKSTGRQFSLLQVSNVLLEQRPTFCCKLQAPGVGKLLRLPAAPLTSVRVPLLSVTYGAKSLGRTPTICVICIWLFLRPEARAQSTEQTDSLCSRDDWGIHCTRALTSVLSTLLNIPSFCVGNNPGHFLY